MGLTIHYGLKSSTRSPEKAHKLVARLRSRAMDLPFERVGEIIELCGPACDFRRCAQDNPHRWLLVQAGQFADDPHYEEYSYGVAPAHVIAFSTWPGEGCEEANFGLCRYPAQIEVTDPHWPRRKKKLRTRLSGWSWGSFCKTQYASNSECGGLRNFLCCHLSVIAMLDFAKSLDILKYASDEGEFWEKRDVETLAREVGQWNQTIAGFAGQLKDLLGDEVLSEITKFPNFEHLEAKNQGGK